MSGKGTFNNTNALVLNNASSKLLLDNTTTVGSVSTTANNSGVDVDQSSTITSLAVGHTTPVSIAAGKTLSGGITVTAGSIKLGETGTLASTVSMSGGTLDADNNLTLSGALSQSGNITIDVAETKILTYEGSTIKIGSSELTILGGGTFSNNTKPLELDNGQSQLNLSGINVSYIRTSSNSLGITVDNSSTVNELLVRHVTPVSIYPNQSLSGSFKIYQNSNLKLNNTGTLAANVAISGLGGKVEVQKSMIFSGSLQQVDQHEGFELLIASGKTMTYSGSEFGIGDHTFKLSGGGTFNNANNLTLNNSGSKLAISESTKISHLLVSASNTNGGMTISSSGSSSTGNLVENLTLSDSFYVSSDVAWAAGNSTADATLTLLSNKNVNFGSLTLTGSADLSLGTTDNITLSVANPVTVNNTQKLQNGGGSLDFVGGLTLKSGSELIGQGQQISGNIELNGGKITAEQSTVLTDNLTQTADSTIHIETSQTLTYGGTAVDIGASKLKMQGGGSFINSAVSALSLNNAGSHLVLDNVTVGFVSASAASSGAKGLNVSADSTLRNLSLTDKLRLSVDTGKTLTLAEPLTVPTQGMELSGAGTLDLTDNLTMNGNVTLASGSLTVDARGLLLNLGGNLNLSGGTLLTDNVTYIRLLSNSILTTDAEQLIANVSIEGNTQPMLSMGSNTTILDVVERIPVDIACPESLPIKPKGQVRLSGGVQINTGGEFCIDGWLEGDIVLNGGTLRIEIGRASCRERV